MDVVQLSATATLGVTKAPLTVIPDAKAVTYGSSVPVYSFTTSGWRNGESPLTSPAGLVLPTCGSSYSPSDAAGTAPAITCSGGSAANYTFDTSKTAAVTVGKATLSVVAEAKSVMAAAGVRVRPV